MKSAAPLVFHLSRLLLGGLFLYAGAVKAMEVDLFVKQVAAYRVLPGAGNVLVAVTLPYAEVLAGFLLLAGRRVRAAALLLGALTVIFMGVLGSVLIRGLDLDCGCFGGSGHLSPLAAMGRDAGILLLAALTFLMRGRQPEDSEVGK